MEQLDSCNICGKKTKLMFVCPNCDKKFCSEHRKQEKHDCENLHEEIFSSSSNSPTLSVAPNELIVDSQNNEKRIVKDDSLNLIEVPEFVYDEKNRDYKQNNIEQKIIKENNNSIEEKSLNKIIEKKKWSINSKIIISVLLILLTISYLVMNGYLFSLFDIFNKFKSI